LRNRPFKCFISVVSLSCDIFVKHTYVLLFFTFNAYNTFCIICLCVCVCVCVPCYNDPALCQHSTTSNGLMHVCLWVWVCACVCVCLHTNTLFVISVKTRSVCDNGERVFQNRVVSVFCVCVWTRICIQCVRSVTTADGFRHADTHTHTHTHTHTKALAHTYTFYRHSRWWVSIVFNCY